MDNKDNIFHTIMDNISKGESSLMNDWKNLVSEDLKEHSKITEINKGIVKVAVSHSGWKNILQLECSRLVYKINKLYPELKIKRIVSFASPETFREPEKLNLSNNKYMEDDPFKDEKKESWDINNVSNLEFREFLKKVRKRGEDKKGES